MMSTTTATGAKNASTDSEVEALKADIAALRGDLKQVVSDIRGIAKTKAEAGVDRGAELASKATEQLGETRTVVETRIRENPLTAIGIAFGAGLVLAMLRRN
jgi:ElaB/YqjD/DUF883 family membrane-anchored ribosome-binding protein